MKLAIFTDLHANLPALERLIEALKEEKVDTVVGLGDYIFIGPYPKETLELLMQQNWLLVRGNHEHCYLQKYQKIPGMEFPNEKKHARWVMRQLRQIPEMVDFIAKMPDRIELDLKEKGKLLFQHSPYSKVDGKTEFMQKRITAADTFNDVPATGIHACTFFGHTHRSMEFVSEDQRRIYFLEPLGCGHTFGGSFYTMNTEDKRFPFMQHHRISYDEKQVLLELKKRRVPAQEFIIKNFYPHIIY